MANAHDLLMAQRAAMMGGKALPYIQRVPYLESHGAEYIDSGVRARTGISILANFVITKSQNDTALCGAKGTGNNRLVPFAMFFTTYSIPRADFVYGIGGDTSMQMNKIEVGGHYEVRIAAGSRIVANVNGIEYSRSANPVDTDTTLRVFAREWNGAINSFASIRLENMSIWLDGVLERSLVPVLDMSGNLCMYNEAQSEIPADDPSRFFYNQGTGEFTTDLDVQT